MKDIYRVVVGIAVNIQSTSKERALEEMKEIITQRGYTVDDAFSVAETEEEYYHRMYVATEAQEAIAHEACGCEKKFVRGNLVNETFCKRHRESPIITDDEKVYHRTSRR